MSDEDLATIARWVDEGVAEGTPRDDLALPAQPSLSAASAFRTPDFIPEIAGGPFAEFDEYRCFLIDPQLDSDKFITGYESLPGNAAIVHHALVMHVDPDMVVGADGLTNLDVMQTLDDTSPDRDGWPCFGLAGEGVEPLGVPVTWAPGMGVVSYPAETGVYMPEDGLLVVQIHYNLAEEELRGQSDVTTVKLCFADSVERVGLFQLSDLFLASGIDGEPDVLEPGRDSVSYTWEQSYDSTLAELGLPYADLYGVFPHMHGLGKKWRFEVIKAGSDAICGGNVERWYYAWELFYFCQQPTRIEPGDSIRVTCEFDTRGLSEPVLPGWGTQNEMCLAGLYLVAP
ncbi:MAG: hypothetical protein AAGC55_20140 [Myxococcota bacterium]